VGCPAWAVIREPADRLISWWNYHKTLKVIGDIYQPNFIDWVNRGYPHHWEWELDYCGIKNPLNQYEFVEISGELSAYLVAYDNIGIYMKQLGVKSIPRIGQTMHFQLPGTIRKKINNDFKKDYKYYVLAKSRGVLHPEFFQGDEG